MQKTVSELISFLNASHSVYHAAAQVVQLLENAGYTRLSEGGAWNLAPGGKYYLVRGGTAVLAFRLPEGEPVGFLMSAAHSDRPTFKLKEHGEQKDAYARLAVEPYGGMLMSTWLDRPLSLAGRVLVRTEQGAEARLVDIDRDLLLIPSVAIHMNRKANEGQNWNPAVDTLPLLGGKEGGSLRDTLQELAGGEILGHDLYLYLRQKARVWGLQEDFLSSAALDDLECVFLCTKGFLDAGASENIPVLCVFDSEEVGSCSAQGAASDLLEALLTRICQARGLDLYRMLANSFMISADNAHALHPNHPELADKGNAPILNGGVVLKFNARQKYTTDGISAAVFRAVCGRAGVPVQSYCNRADIPGGSTLGNISLAHVSVPTADVGLPQLAMHSAYETAGTLDAESLRKAMTVYYGSTFRSTENGFLLA